MPRPRNCWQEQVRETIAANRKLEAARKLRRIDTEVLTVEGVAEFLHCSVAAARSIPADQLPRHSGPGRRGLFLKEDVVRYVRGNSKVRSGVVDDDMVRRSKARALGSVSDSGRRRSRKKETDQ